MILHRKKGTSEIIWVDRLGVAHAIAAVYVGAVLVWEAVTSALSCFANGYWQGSSPWTGDEPWNGFGR